eukprot:EC797680.1.p1 GENE.EC797680.1~~EC797680.1.p1  ORF type:complete len:134 (-),score=16.93 EC797680.1:47-448(-)
MIDNNVQHLESLTLHRAKAVHPILMTSECSQQHASFLIEWRSMSVDSGWLHPTAKKNNDENEDDDDGSCNSVTIEEGANWNSERQTKEYPNQDPKPENRLKQPWWRQLTRRVKSSQANYDIFNSALEKFDSAS